MPHKAAGTGGRAVLGPVYEGLLVFDSKIENGKQVDYRADWPVVPWLAERWEAPDESTYIFHLRRGVTWHDGKEFTAADVVFTYGLVRDPKNAFPTRSRLPDMNAVTALDSHTVKVTTLEASPHFLVELASPYNMVLPKHVADRGDSFDEVAIGTGPFKVQSFDRAKSSAYVRYDNFRLPGKPFLDGVEVFFNLDRSARNAAFITKAVDVRAAEDKVQFDTIIKAVPDAGYGTPTNANQETIILRADKPPFNDPRVRRAINLAVDRQGVLKLAAFDVGVINPPGMHGGQSWAIPPSELAKLPGYRQPKEADLAEARRLLAEAGHGSGLTFSLLFDPARTSAGKIAEVVASQLRAVQIDVVLRSLPRAEFAKAYAEGAYDTVIESAGDMLVGGLQFDYWHSKGSLHTMGFSDPQLDRFIDVLVRSRDVNQRKEAALGMQRVLLERDYIIPTIAVGVFQLWHPWVRDYIYNMGSSELFEQDNLPRVWFTKDAPTGRK